MKNMTASFLARADSKGVLGFDRMLFVSGFSPCLAVAPAGGIVNGRGDFCDCTIYNNHFVINNIVGYLR
jgi:hypothetical protein